MTRTTTATQTNIDGIDYVVVRCRDHAPKVAAFLGRESTYTLRRPRGRRLFAAVPDGAGFRILCPMGWDSN